MNLKTAIIVGVIGAAISAVLALLPIIQIDAVMVFLYRNPIGRVFHAIPGLCFLFFFVTLLVKQK
ncbi:MAG: hypothetical protein K9J85_10795 [Desulfobacteraceae bacterium]|nr:hypothetical protein [Desulfobacteraceae bacterium]